MSDDKLRPTPSAISRGGKLPAALLVFALMIIAGCTDLVSVDTVDIIQPVDLENRLGAQALRAGAIHHFTESFAGTSTGNSQVVASGRISDELVATHPNDRYDLREIPELSPVLSTTFDLISQARLSLLQAIDAMQRFDPDSSGDISELFALLAYTELFLGENFCSGVPLSSIASSQPIYGDPLTTQQMLERSIADFETAQAFAGDQMALLNLARVGKGRALLQLGRFADAAAAVSDVPSDFTYQTSHAPATQQNAAWAYLRIGRLASVGDREGGNGLPFVTAQDPRLPTELLGVGFDNETPLYVPEKYSHPNSPVTLASGTEARLIEAEALLYTGNASGALETLNILRATEPNLTSLSMQSSDSARVAQLFHERAFWLFATGQRHGDLRRLVRQYGRPVESVFPTGPYKYGLTYGSDVTLDLHARETLNPQFTGCFNRDP